METLAQAKLNPEQISEFYHDRAMDDQLRDFKDLLADRLTSVSRVVDLGGGVGYFAEALAASSNLETFVIDMDPESIRRCRQRGVPGTVGDAVKTDISANTDVATLNLMLHHLVASGFSETERLQQTALTNLLRPHRLKYVFVNEYIYESFVVPSFSGKLIFFITSSRLLSRAASIVASVIPALRANTFGVGVRFRAAGEWADLFTRAGWRVVGHVRGEEEPIGVARRFVLALRSWRRDSFLLERA